MEKTCSRCGKTQPLGEFHKDKQTKDGHRCACKECMRVIARAYSVAYPERMTAARKRWNEANPEQVAATQKRWKEAHPERVRDIKLRSTYGISQADYAEMLKTQGRGCAICGKTKAEEGMRLSVDHDHDTGEVRGLLCGSCNRAIGLLRHDPELLRSATVYLDQWRQG